MSLRFLFKSWSLVTGVSPCTGLAILHADHSTHRVSTFCTCTGVLHKLKPYETASTRFTANISPQPAPEARPKGGVQT